MWGSWWKDHQWGYKCCKQSIKNSYCTGLAGIEAAEASADLMKANMARKEAAEGMLSNNCCLIFVNLSKSWNHIYDRIKPLLLKK